MQGRDIDESLKQYITGDDIEVHMLKDPKQQALFYQMERLSEQYAKKFFHLLFGNEIGKIESNLPLVFVCEYDAIYDSWQSGEDYISGQVKTSALWDKNLVIRIVLPVRTKRAYLHKSLKQTIRHELIHYYLRLCDLPGDDDDGLFWAYCYIYDAGAYEPMNPKDMARYIRFVEICDTDGQDATYNDLQILAEAVMLDDKKQLENWNTITQWRRDTKAAMERYKEQHKDE